MSTTRIKDKLSQLIGSQLPEFVSSDYTTFVDFVEAYYRFLEQDEHAFELIQNAQQYSDIDLTAASFVNYFLKNYAKDFPTSSLVNKRFFIKRIKDLYESKGSELSFKLLFKLLYDETVETSHPYDLVLRASDGLWDQRLSIRVNLISGSVDGLVDKLLVLQKEGVTHTETILRTRLLEESTYEIFIPSNSTTPFAIDDDVFVGTFPNYDFLGKVVPTTSTLDILDPGSGFKAGSVFNITLLGGSGTLIKVLKTDSSTGIQLAKIINYGFGYESNTNIVFDLINELGAAPSTSEFASNIGGLVDSIVVAAPQTAGSSFDYFAEDYVEASGGFISFSHTVLTSNTYGNYGTSVTNVIDNPENVAILRLNMGALARYPGEYRSPRGFLSEPDVRLQDDKLYQPFAYQVKSDLDIVTFYDVVKKLIHPAGTNLFSNRTLTNNANIRSNISVITRSNLHLLLNDTLSITDSQAFAYSLPLSSNVSTSDVNYIKSSLKLLDDSLSVEDSGATLSTNKGLSNSVIELDVIDNFSISIALEDNTTPEDSVTVGYSIVFEDNTSPTDTITLTTALGAFSDTVSLADNTIVSRFLSNSVVLADTVSGVRRNYVEVHLDYFAEDYVQETVI